MAEERTEQIVHAFISLVAERGLEAVTLDDVADRAEVKRPTIRHYIGNRDALIREAFAALKRRYDERADDRLGPEPSIDELAEYLFGDAYVTESLHEDLAFASLLVEAQRDPELATTIRTSYQTTIDRIAAGVLRERTDLTYDEAASLGYQVLCLAEFNVDLQRLGFNSTWSRASMTTARHLLRSGRPYADDEH